MIVSSKTHADGSVVELEADDDFPSATLCRRLADERRQAEFQEEMKRVHAERRRKGLPL